MWWVSGFVTACHFQPNLTFVGKSEFNLRAISPIARGLPKCSSSEYSTLLAGFCPQILDVLGSELKKAYPSGKDSTLIASFSIALKY
jgi:hypothetical protein